MRSVGLGVECGCRGCDEVREVTFQQMPRNFAYPAVDEFSLRFPHGSCYLRLPTNFFLPVACMRSPKGNLSMLWKIVIAIAHVIASDLLRFGFHPRGTTITVLTPTLSLRGHFKKSILPPLPPVPLNFKSSTIPFVGAQLGFEEHSQEGSPASLVFE